MNFLLQRALQLKNLLNQPTKVFLFTTIFTFITLIWSGSVFKLWSLYQEQDRLIENVIQTKSDILKLDVKLKQVVDPVYIERQARDRMDLVSDHDLIFVFPE